MLNALFIEITSFFLYLNYILKKLRSQIHNSVLFLLKMTEDCFANRRILCLSCLRQGEPTRDRLMGFESHRLMIEKTGNTRKGALGFGKGAQIRCPLDFFVMGLNYYISFIIRRPSRHRNYSLFISEATSSFNIH